MNCVDDASGVALGRFSSEETTRAAADLLEAWVRQYGVPKALYCDWKNVYKRQPTLREVIEGIEPETQLGRMCAKLGIGIIAGVHGRVDCCSTACFRTPYKSIRYRRLVGGSSRSDHNM